MEWNQYVGELLATVQIQTSRLNLVNVETELQQLISDGESVIMTQRKLMTQARALKDGIEALEKQKTINDEKLSEKESQLTSFEQQSKGQSTSPSVDVRSVTGRFTTWLQKTSGSSDQNVNAVTEAGGFVNGLTFSGLEVQSQSRDSSLNQIFTLTLRDCSRSFCRCN